MSKFSSFYPHIQNLLRNVRNRYIVVSRDTDKLVFLFTNKDENIRTENQKSLRYLLCYWECSHQEIDNAISVKPLATRDFMFKLSTYLDKRMDIGLINLYHTIMGTYNPLSKKITIPQLRVWMTSPHSPAKCRGTDIGYDIWITKVHKRLTQRTTLYRTGVHIEPSAQFYVCLVPRSSISKTGYMISNSMGIIDQLYQGEILVSLTRIDDKDPNNQPLPTIEERLRTGPIRVAQLIMNPAIHFNIHQMSMEETSSGVVSEAVSEAVPKANQARGSQGFGSTGMC